VASIEVFGAVPAGGSKQWGLTRRLGSMAFGFPKSRTRAREGVSVTSAQVAAARLIIERAQSRHKPVDDAVVAIANAEAVPGTTDYRVVRFKPPGVTPGSAAPAGGAAAR
jgi:hypothetical protein